MIYKTERSGNRKILAQVPENRVTAFTHISGDGKRLCVPMTDGRCLEFDPVTEGTGLGSKTCLRYRWESAAGAFKQLSLCL